MIKRALFTTVMWLVLMASGAVSCAGDGLSSPEQQVVRARPSSASNPRAALEQAISAINFLLYGGGFQEALGRGGDSAVIQARRQRAVSDLAALLERLHQLDNSQRPAEAELVDEGMEPPPCFLNGNLDGCFFDWYTTLTIGGTGTVYQQTFSIFHHNTTTFLTDNGATYGNPRTTSNFGLTPFHYAAIAFTAPNCNTAGHEIKGTTSHRVSIGIFDLGEIEGHQQSNDRAVCFRKYLTVSVSPSSIGPNSVANVTVSHLPASGCALTVTSSNTDVATIQDLGGYYNALSGQPGITTITASCSDGSSGSAPLTVTSDDDHPDVYEAAGDTGEGGVCADENTYYWWHWNEVDQEYAFMGEVCLDTRLTYGAALEPGLSLAVSTATVATTRSDVTLAVTSSLPAGAHVRVLRRSHQVPQQVVLVDPYATSEDLVIAFATVGALRMRDGESPTADLQRTPSGYLNPGPELHKESATKQAFLERLRKAPLTNVAGIGSVQTLDVDLGPKPRNSKP